ncbi:hypothetical protein Tco_0601583 [Tanacetum coccineum]
MYHRPLLQHPKINGKSKLKARLDLFPLDLKFFQEALLACEDDIQEVLDHYNNVVPELTFAKTNEMLKEEIPRLVNLTVTRDREIALTNLPELISKEFTAHTPSIITELF